MRRDGTLNNGGILYQKTTGVTVDTGWTANVAAQVVATTITGLGSGFPGAQGMLRLGSSPYEFLVMVYDGSYGKWVSPIQQVATGWNVGAGNPGMSWYDLANPVLMDWSQFYAAGLKLQAKFVINGRDTSNNQNNTQARIVTGHFAATGAPPTNTTAYGTTSVGSMNYLTSISGLNAGGIREIWINRVMDSALRHGRRTPTQVPAGERRMRVLSYLHVPIGVFMMAFGVSMIVRLF